MRQTQANETVVHLVAKYMNEFPKEFMDRTVQLIVEKDDIPSGIELFKALQRCDMDKERKSTYRKMLNGMFLKADEPRWLTYSQGKHPVQILGPVALEYNEIIIKQSHRCLKDALKRGFIKPNTILLTECHPDDPEWVVMTPAQSIANDLKMTDAQKTRALKILVQFGEEMKGKNRGGKEERQVFFDTPIKLAIRRCNEETVIFLMDNGAEYNPHIFYSAFSNGLKKVCLKLLDKHPEHIKQFTKYAKEYDDADMLSFIESQSLIKKIDPTARKPANRSL